MKNRSESANRKGMRQRVVGLLGSLAVAVAGLMIVAPPANAAGSCTRTAEAPYKHVRITGQKQVYGKGSFYCTGSRVAISVDVRIAKYNPADQQWYWVSTNRSHTSDSSSYQAALAYGWLCNNYGWGSQGSGYCRTYVRGTWMEYGGGSLWTTPYVVSGYRYLSC
jgi:hypothetical protein